MICVQLASSPSKSAQCKRLGVFIEQILKDLTQVYPEFECLTIVYAMVKLTALIFKISDTIKRKYNYPMLASNLKNAILNHLNNFDKPQNGL